MKKINPNKLRKKVLDIVYSKKSGHIGGSFSIAEIISFLYSNYDFDKENKLILSKGHAVPIVYAVLHELNKITDEDFNLFREINSPLQGHPDKEKLSYIHATTGSLGQGLSISIGHSLAKSLKKEDGEIFCIIGDGELQEGQIWEALSYYPKLNLTNMVCFLDWNKHQSDNLVNETIPIYDNLETIINNMGWDCKTINGHDEKEIENCLNKNRTKPLFVILNTIKGKGVSFMENPSWHSKIPTDEEYKKAIIELGV